MKTIPVVLLTLAAIAALQVHPAAAEEPERPVARMTTYYVGLIHSGPQWSPHTTAETLKVQQEHAANLQKLTEEGKLVLSGRFADDGDLRGMLVLKVATLQEARNIVRSDPAVSAGQIRIELHPWYSASGIRSDETPAVTAKP